MYLYPYLKMSNENSGIEFIGNQDVIGNVIKPEFEFKGSNEVEGNNDVLTDRVIGTDIDINSNSEHVDDYVQNVSQNFDSNKDSSQLENTKKEVPVVIQQKYGASV